MTAFLQALASARDVGFYPPLSKLKLLEAGLEESMQSASQESYGSKMFRRLEIWQFMAIFFL